MDIVPHHDTGRVVIPAPLTHERLAVRAARELASPFDPADLVPGDRLGWLVLVSEPRKIRLHKYVCRCTWDVPSQNDPAPCDEESPWYTADVLCSCGWFVPAMMLTGDPMTQRLSCGCHRNNPPNVAHYQYQRGAWKLTPPPLKAAA